MDSMTEALTELAKASPFAVMCVLVVFILHLHYSKNLKAMRKLYDSSIKEMKELYKTISEETVKKQESKKR